ncbi:MAG TPA: hypothetical protein VMU11_00625 [Verrucomicrobiae bacterium]|nr:hypothetical protein [Verrucomicrobiae bacterium]
MIPKNRNMAADAEVANEVTAITGLVTGSLLRGGLNVGFEEIAVPLMFAHVLEFADDIVCVALQPRAGYVLKTGVRLPVGEHPEHPSSVEVYVSLEDGDAGMSVIKRTKHRMWYARFWDRLNRGLDIGNIRRDVFGETRFNAPTRLLSGGQVDEALQCMAGLYMGRR